MILSLCKDAKERWDLRSKIRVQQLPLFKYLQLGDVKIGIFVSTRLERLKYKQTQFLALRCHKRYDMHADTGYSVGKGANREEQKLEELWKGNMEFHWGRNSRRLQRDIAGESKIFLDIRQGDKEYQAILAKRGTRPWER